ncbi:hypothetical protein ABW16_02310 [Mycolicibacter heraklionensis]|uniref:Uncharacterized protein n=1 Tax=Mycolicibacter heraklionensis TaxID=512402 RepID=A0A9X7WI02_9MYCO|nr:hypothetical protein [Mycolicibacter heraklionensis]KLO31674.1 hypothetical protein ABW16_02310 [Mycolicibacter heraklionensis]QZA08623.1 hypothetical protein K3U94_04835 [Mycolicibacter heraklionensis]
MLNRRRKASVVAIAGAALLGWAPIAGADDPPACDEKDLQCQLEQDQEQDQGAGIAQRVIDETKQGADRANKALQEANQGNDQAKKAIDLSDKNCWVVNGVPTMWSPGLATGPGQRAEPCYYVYGLTPH